MYNQLTLSIDFFSIMLVLDDNHYFAKGYSRNCYTHPSNDNRCLKIAITQNPKRTPGIVKGIERENKYYKHLAKQNISWAHLSQYYGDIETNRGLASVYQLIRDPDNQISKSLEYCLSEADFIKKHSDQLISALNELFKYMKDNVILTTSLLPRNIVVQLSTTSVIKLYLIDDIGSSEFIPFSQYIRYLGKRKVVRKWEKMLKLILSKNQNLPTDFIKKLQELNIS